MQFVLVEFESIWCHSDIGPFSVFVYCGKSFLFVSGALHYVFHANFQCCLFTRNLFQLIRSSTVQFNLFFRTLVAGLFNGLIVGCNYYCGLMFASIVLQRTWVSLELVCLLSTEIGCH